jgi:hypothetical protein
VGGDLVIRYVAKLGVTFIRSHHHTKMKPCNKELGLHALDDAKG